VRNVHADEVVYLAYTHTHTYTYVRNVHTDEVVYLAYTRIHTLIHTHMCATCTQMRWFTLHSHTNTHSYIRICAQRARR